MIHQNILSIDFGEKKVGLAFKESGYREPRPIGNFKNRGDLIRKIISVVKEKKVDKILLGYPLKLNKKKSPITYIVENFENCLSQSLPKGIELVRIDETWTTREAIEKLRFLGRSEKYIKKHKDSYAAVLILERYLKHAGI